MWLQLRPHVTHSVVLLATQIAVDGSAGGRCLETGRVA
jgi:hypothetical protein